MLNLRLSPERRSIALCRLIAFLMLLILTASNLLYGRAFYLSTSGNDSNSGSLSAPWRTFAHAIPLLYPGDTLLVRAGSYKERVLVGTRSGYRVAPIVIKNYPGEIPIIDGRWPFSDQVSVPLSTGLLHVRARNVIVEGFKIRRSNACGIMSDVTYDTFRRIQVDSCWQSGIYVGGDSSVVEDCKVWNVNLNNYNGAAYANGAWGLGITMARGGGGQDAGEDNVTDGGIIRRDTVYDCWGEGISTYQAKGTKIDSCVIWDAWSTSLYVQNAAYCHVNGCLVYSTRDLPNGQGGYRRATTYSVSNEAASDTVMNRYDTLSFNCGYGGWAMFRTTLGTGSLCVNNTFVNSTIGGSIRVVDYRASGWTFKNNIIEQDDGLAVTSCDNTSGLVFTSSNNCWYGSTPASWAQGTGSMYSTNPQLVRGDASAGHMTRDWFKLQSTSPAIDAGVNVGYSYQGSAPDMGAVEYGSTSGGGSGSTVSPVSTLLSPANDATDQPTTIAFSWTAAMNATSYQLQVSVASDFSVIYKEAVPVSGTSTTISGLATGIRYYWRVRASVSGQMGAWSSVSSFTTVIGSSSTLAPAPTLLSPANGATGQPTILPFSWSAVPNATGYRLQVSMVSDFSSLAFEVVPVYGTSSTISGLAAGTTYYWRVRASVGDQMGAWSATSSFATAGGTTAVLQAPQLTSPTSGATGVSINPTLAWGAVSGATSYHVQLSLASDFSTTVYDLASVSGTSQSVGNLALNTCYYWRVSSGNQNATSGWSQVFNFTTTAKTKRPRARLSTSTLNFGQTPVLQTRTMSVSIANDGDDTLRVAEVVCSNPVFSASVRSFLLAPGDSLIDSVRACAPGTVGYISDFAIVQSNCETGSDTITLRLDVVTTTSADREETPTAYALSQNYPNPFNPTTTIGYALPENSRVTIEIFDILGSRIRTLVSDLETSAGNHTVQWDGKNDDAARVSTGMYIYRIKANSFVATRTMLLLN